jgi:hypothetical protein
MAGSTRTNGTGKRARREPYDEQWVDALIKETQAEQALNPWTQEQILAEEAELARYAAQQTKKVGIKQRDIVRLIHEQRKARRAQSRPGQ